MTCFLRPGGSAFAQPDQAIRYQIEKSKSEKNAPTWLGATRDVLRHFTALPEKLWREKDSNLCLPGYEPGILPLNYPALWRLRRSFAAQPAIIISFSVA